MDTKLQEYNSKRELVETLIRQCSEFVLRMKKLPSISTDINYDAKQSKQNVGECAENININMSFDKLMCRILIKDSED